MKKRLDVYQEVTNKIIEELERGAAPWVKTWAGSPVSSLPRNAVSNRTYSGVNILLLWIESSIHGYINPSWLTFKQAKSLGGSIKKGEKGTHIVFFTRLEKEDEKGNTVEIPMLKGFTVFNVEQCDGLPEKYHGAKNVEPLTDDNDSHMWEFLSSTGAAYKFGGSRACYSPSLDIVTMPERAAFKSVNEFWATFCHELTHWTGSEKRLNRVFGKRFGDDAYAMEELVAELGAAFACAVVGIENREVRHAGYIANWLKVLRADKKAIFTAASAASKACDFLVKNYSEEHKEERQVA